MKFALQVHLVSNFIINRCEIIKVQLKWLPHGGNYHRKLIYFKVSYDNKEFREIIMN